MATISATGCVMMWFRRDLRLADNPALHAAVQTGMPLVLVFVDDRDRRFGVAPGAAADWWLHGSLQQLSLEIAERGGALTLHRGDPAGLLPSLAGSLGAREVFWNRSGEPSIDARDREIAARLRQDGITPRVFHATTLVDPDQLKTGSGQPYKVFSAFWRAALRTLAPNPALPAPASLTNADTPSGDESLASWSLRPTSPDWATGFAAEWEPGEAGARRRLDRFLDAALDGYADGRDRPDQAGTSRLSPHFGFGEISPRQVWHAVHDRLAAGAAVKPAEKFIAELGWRDFAYYLLHHFTDLRSENFNRAFNHFPWRHDPEGLGAWKRGETGLPLVDAGMRQLWATGWMHNRVRMVCASFLVKHLGCHWREGMDWFEHTLVDADRAVNAASWQWVAGSGADAAPYFRIFNPVRQGETFDPQGAYIRRWVPELSRMSGPAIYAPWKGRPPRGYPEPVVGLESGRDSAMAAYHLMRSASAADL